MEAIDPVKRVAIEKIGDLGAAEIIDRRVPVRLETLARVGVLVERGAVEMRQPLLVSREMRRHPVEDDAKSDGVRSIHEAREGGRVAEPPGRSEEADRLVAPGLVERMLTDRQKLEMGVAHLGDVGDELIGKFVVGEESSALAPSPGAEMHFVD